MSGRRWANHSESLNDRQSDIFLKLSHPIQTILCRLRTAKRTRRVLQIASLTLGFRSAQRTRPSVVCDIFSVARLPVKVFKSLIDRQSYIFDSFRKSSEPIMSKLSYVE